MALRPLEPESPHKGFCNSFKILGDALPTVVSKDSFFPHTSSEFARFCHSLVTIFTPLLDPFNPARSAIKALCQVSRTNT